MTRDANSIASHGTIDVSRFNAWKNRGSTILAEMIGARTVQCFADGETSQVRFQLFLSKS